MNLHEDIENAILITLFIVLFVVALPAIIIVDIIGACVEFIKRKKEKKNENR